MVVSSRLSFATRRLENALCQHQQKVGIFSNQKVGIFSNQGRTKQRKERDGLRFSFAVQYNGILTPTAPTTIRLWDTITFFIFEMNVTCNYNINHLNDASYQLLLVILKVLRIALQNSPHLNNVGIT